MRLKSLTDDPALLLVLAAASHRSFRPPWGHPRYPARDGGAERLVLSPKRPLERGFFVRHDEDVEGEPEQRAVDDEAPIAHQHRLTQDDGNDRDVYWITHITVETGHHEIPGRRDGRGGAETLQRETRKCVNEPRHACENHYRADAARQLQTKERRPELPTRDRPWNEPRRVHGATTKKTAEPRTAMVRCTAVPDTPRRCELIPTSPSWFPVVIRVPTRSPCYPKSGNRARLKPECHGGNEAQG